jgi:hypothetical protein
MEGLRRVVGVVWERDRMLAGNEYVRQCLQDVREGRRRAPSGRSAESGIHTRCTGMHRGESGATSSKKLHACGMNSPTRGALGAC